MKHIIILLMFVCAPLFCRAQNIYLMYSGNDPVGGRLVFSLKEEVRKSAIYNMADSPENAIHLTINTIDPVDGIDYLKGTSTSVIVLMTFSAADKGGEILVWYDHRILGSDRINEAAKDMLAAIDRKVDELRKATKDRHKNEAPK